jgi:hypothetical protein
MPKVAQSMMLAPMPKKLVVIHTNFPKKASESSEDSEYNDSYDSDDSNDSDNNIGSDSDSRVYDKNTTCDHH